MIIPLLAALVLCVGVLTVTWIAAVKLDNFGIVDAVWAFCFTAVAALFALMAGNGWLPRRLLLLAVVSLWSLRLGYHLARRIAGHHPVEDSRYVGLREEYGANYRFRFFAFFQMQAVSVVVLALPFWLIARNSLPGFAPLEIAGAVLTVVALIGEGIADRQLKNFKANPRHRGEVCDVGLWRYSRHPNYFFESLVWWGYFLFALGSPGGYLAVYCPLIMLLLLLKVTGVPPAEAQSLKSKGAKYRAYQARTSVFFPWFPKGE